MNLLTRERLVVFTLAAGFAAGVSAANWWPKASQLLPMATAQITRTTTATPVANVAAATAGMTPEEEINVRVYQLANPSVVNIDTSIVQYDRFFMSAIPGQGSGSGSVIDNQGHILTNFHVVDGAREIQVTFASNNAYPAKVVGYDAEADIAVLKVDAPQAELKPIALGQSDNLLVGQRAFVLGNPFGLEGTLTTGIILSVNRTLDSRAEGRSMKSIIQTDAAMNPGNSGGPLLDSSGKMIGMNVAIASKSGSSAGVGFAIPVNRIKQVLPQLIKHGRITRPDHGIVAVAETDRGLKVVKVVPGGPADRAGLRGYSVKVDRQVRGNAVYEMRSLDRSRADYIVAVDGQPVSGHGGLIDLIETHKPGDTITLTVVREGRTEQLRLTLGAE